MQVGDRQQPAEFGGGLGGPREEDVRRRGRGVAAGAAAAAEAAGRRGRVPAGGGNTHLEQ